MKKTFGFLTAIFVFSSCYLFSSCYYDVEKQLYPPSGCDTTNATYASYIAPLMQNNCTACHSTAAPSANIILDTYNGVKSAATSGKLYGSMSHASGFIAMPPSGTKLNSCDLTKVNKWITAGSPNN
ncbi:MAG: hypothetical protein EKK37_16645 [Sphingobacteriales bacterium]|nr:MAG: hypothetical protein EKK37_16645 [Sphingobacteriales bacterium]